MKDLVKQISAASKKMDEIKKSGSANIAKQGKAEKQVKVKTCYALLATPRGKALFTYWLAIMSSLGMFTTGRKAVNKANVRKFFQSGSLLAHHSKNGNLEETADGKIRLTVTGWNYFSGRLNGSTVGQEVDKPEMEILAEAIKAGKMPEKTARFSQDTKFRQIDITA